MRFSPTLFVFLCVILENQVVAFLAWPTAKSTSKYCIKNEGLPPSTSFSNSKFSKSTLLNAKKGNNLAETESEPPSALGLLVTYMTPWRNPNSIFVYMLLLLVALGKYSETHIITNN